MKKLNEKNPRNQKISHGILDGFQKISQQNAGKAKKPNRRGEIHNVRNHMPAPAFRHEDWQSGKYLFNEVWIPRAFLTNAPPIKKLQLNDADPSEITKNWFCDPLETDFLQS